jgi:hypothetical protein
MKKNGVTIIRGDDRRFIDSCITVLQTRNFQILNSFETAQEGADCINKIVQALNCEPKDKESFVKQLINQAKQRLLPLEKLEWLRSNERACSVFFKVVVIICLFVKQLLFLDLDVRHQLAYSS